VVGARRGEEAGLAFALLQGPMILGEIQLRQGFSPARPMYRDGSSPGFTGKERLVPMESKKTTQERRKGDRREVHLPVEVVLEEGRLMGYARNLSQGGVLAIVPGGVRVKVRVGEEEKQAQLIRVQALDPQNWGLALLFDEPMDMSKPPE